MRLYDAGDRVILDIGHSLGSTIPIVVEMYTLGLAWMPAVFADGPPFGAIRRSGVLWVEAAAYRDFTEAVHAQMLATPDYPGVLRRRLNEVLQRLEDRCQQYFVAGDTVLGEVWDALLPAMGFVAFNWLLPREQLQAQVAQYTGYDPGAAEQWLLRVSVPAVPPHFFVFRRHLLGLVARELAREEPDIAAFARVYGCLQTSSLPAAPLEHPDMVLAEVRALAAQYGTIESARAAITQLDAAHQKALETRAQAVSAACARALQRGHDPAHILRIADLLMVAADEEEDRHAAQMRAMSVLRRAAEWRGLAVGTLRAAQLDLPIALRFTNDRGW